MCTIDYASVGCQNIRFFLYVSDCILTLINDVVKRGKQISMVRVDLPNGDVPQIQQ